MDPKRAVPASAPADLEIGDTVWKPALRVPGLIDRSFKGVASFQKPDTDPPGPGARVMQITVLDLSWAAGPFQSAAVKAPIGIEALQKLARKQGIW